ncbi:phosphatidylglycerophosphatase A, partial [bacterium]|nr:phosphatidylglycerophosphatase A [bacterium]
NSWKIMAAGFVLFRVIDICKIYPADLVESKVPGGLGVVLDDVVAGIYANAILQIIIRLSPGLLR